MKKLFYNILTIAVVMFITPSCEDVLDQQAVDTYNEQAVFWILTW